MPADFRYLALFKGVQQEELRRLAMCAVTRAYPKHTIIMSEGDATDAIYMIVSGKVKIYLSDESGKELILAIKGAGEYFGEMGLDGGPREAPTRLAMSRCVSLSGMTSLPSRGTASSSSTRATLP